MSSSAYGNYTTPSNSVFSPGTIGRSIYERSNVKRETEEILSETIIKSKKPKISSCDDNVISKLSSTNSDLLYNHNKHMTQHYKLSGESSKLDDFDSLKMSEFFEMGQLKPNYKAKQFHSKHSKLHNDNGDVIENSTDESEDL